MGPHWPIQQDLLMFLVAGSMKLLHWTGLAYIMEIRPWALSWSTEQDLLLHFKPQCLHFQRGLWGPLDPGALGLVMTTPDLAQIVSWFGLYTRKVLLT